jgi:16S rRNA (adenine1518-N6/adenine1519-N6)-dimethyltransferase
MRTKRRVLGQHFLNSTTFAERIAQAAEVKNQVVLEIGSGKGILTKQLAQRACKVIAVEIDARLADHLRKLNLPGVQVLNTDFLKINLRDWNKVSVVGNIPYSITSTIIRRLAENREYIEHAVLTMQKEYAAKMMAAVGRSEYGYTSIYANHYFEVRKEFNIPPRFFSPSPKVSSVVITLSPRAPKYDAAYEARFFEFVAGLFRYRRKSLKNAILSYQARLPEGLDDRRLTSRPQYLSLEDYHEIYRKASLIS